MIPTRRHLRFASLEEAVRDAENLLDKGYDRAGQWTLGQCCGHLSLWLTYPIDGFPRMPFPIAAMMWVLRRTVGPKKLKQYIETGTFPSGQPTVPETVPDVSEDDRAAVARFRQAAERLMKHEGPIIPSPFFGTMNRETALKIQAVHSAHHLSFLIPRNG